MAAVQLRNTNPLGAVYDCHPGLDRVVEAGEVFEVDADVAAVLLEQVGNYEAVKPGKTAPPESVPGEPAAEAPATPSEG